jgi:hypothetical protein
LRRNHARAQRRHAGEEGGATGRAALLGVIGHEFRTFLTDAVDVGRFPNHQALVVNARLHPADVIAHDKENVRLFARRLRNTRQCDRQRRTRQQFLPISFHVLNSR